MRTRSTPRCRRCEGLLQFVAGQLVTKRHECHFRGFAWLAVHVARVERCGQAGKPLMVDLSTAQLMELVSEFVPPRFLIGQCLTGNHNGLVRLHMDRMLLRTTGYLAIAKQGAPKGKSPLQKNVAGFSEALRLVVAPRPGLEPGTYGLTVRRSTD